MTNLFSKFSLILDIAKTYFQDTVLPCGNFKRGPIPSKMSDLEIIALSLVSEALSMDSENLLFKKLATDHCSEFPNLIDRGYLSAKVQLDLFESFKIRPKVPYRNNMNEQVEIDPENRRQGKQIETMFSQFCDQFILKRNDAKSYLGWLTRT